MFREALDAADFLLTRFERKLDEAIGRNVRLALGRYASVVVIGVPLAWAIEGFRWDRTAALGLLAGLILFAILDGLKTALKTRRR
jgi:ABC-type Co2+ transport system permease subunit